MGAGSDRWTRIAVARPECAGISREFLNQQRGKGERYFAQEYLCQFVQPDDTLFSDEDIEVCISDEIPTLWD